ncbi:MULTISPECIES: dTDP-glucose 4,6-dehydratase [unclassified Streptomyces]|uniref:dTDP-glucose 4,6-dehydratase n=1 Tax=unclassified Streptomyces TaxID=2593676 RepID=UPI000DD9C9DC|nr:MULTISPECIES: NAD-dependent epimerase/dehydratase family protein [unclassified Streptomyces]QZZ31664.1 NAD-dependent epimerase/dehydratase family protein [Streptomyces sp. ST1015]
MRILVTGAAGFTGSHFVRSLLAGAYRGWEGARVTALDKRPLPQRHARVEAVRGDVGDPFLLRDLLPGHDAVVHFADVTRADTAELVRTNVLGTHTLLDAVRGSGVERTVVVSSADVYGPPAGDGAPWTEDHPVRPITPYATSRAAADLVARCAWHTHGVDLSVTRSTACYGPRQQPDRPLPRRLTALLEGTRSRPYDDAPAVTEWLHVDDHCRAVHLVLNRGRAGETYHVGGEAVAPAALAEHLHTLTGTRAVAHDSPAPARVALDDSRIREELGWAPAVPFEQGLADTVGWYRDHPGWWTAARRARETTTAAA